MKYTVALSLLIWWFSKRVMSLSYDLLDILCMKLILLCCYLLPSISHFWSSYFSDGICSVVKSNFICFLRGYNHNKDLYLHMKIYLVAMSFEFSVLLPLQMAEIIWWDWLRVGNGAYFYFVISFPSLLSMGLVATSSVQH